MLSEKNLKELNLTEEQLLKYRELEKREKALRRILKKCGVHPTAIDGIVRKSDLKRVDLDNLGALEESVKKEWSEVIMKKNGE